MKIAETTKEGFRAWIFAAQVEGRELERWTRLRRAARRPQWLAFTASGDLGRKMMRQVAGRLHGVREAMSLAPDATLDGRPTAPLATRQIRTRRLCLPRVATNSDFPNSRSIPLDLPGARGGLPVPVAVVSGAPRVGAAGLGWDVRIFGRPSRTCARRTGRKARTKGVNPELYLYVLTVTFIV